MLTPARHFSISWARRMQYTPYHPFLIQDSMLSSHLRLYLPSCLFLGFLTEILYARLASTIRATCPAHLIILSLIIWRWVWIMKLLIMYLLPVFSYLQTLQPIFFSTLFSNTINLCYSPVGNVRNQVCTHIKLEAKFIALYLLIFIFLDGNWRQKILVRMVSDIPRVVCYKFLHWMQFWFVRIVPKCLDCAIISKYLLCILCCYFYCFIFKRGHKHNSVNVVVYILTNII